MLRLVSHYCTFIEAHFHGIPWMFIPIFRIDQYQIKATYLSEGRLSLSRRTFFSMMFPKSLYCRSSFLRLGFKDDSNFKTTSLIRQPESL